MEILQIQKEGSDLGQATHLWPLLFNTAHLWQVSMGRQATAETGIKNSSSAERLPRASRSGGAHQKSAYPSPAPQEGGAVTPLSHRRKTDSGPSSQHKPLVRYPGPKSIKGCWGSQDSWRSSTCRGGAEWSKAAHKLVTQKSKLEGGRETREGGLKISTRGHAHPEHLPPGLEFLRFLPLPSVSGASLHCYLCLCLCMYVCVYVHVCAYV